MKAKIEVFESPLSSKVIATFKTIRDLIKWNKKHNVFADTVAVNGCLLYDWDELYDFV
jgi:hypothetical protein